MFLVFLGLFLISTCFGNKDNKTIDYCKINKEHVLCGAEKDLKIEGPLKSFTPKDDGDRNNFLEMLNNFRHEVAGNMFPMGQDLLPAAGNMLELTYDYELERAAKNLLRICGSYISPNCCNCMNTGKMDVFATEHIFNYTDTRIKNPTLRIVFRDLYNLNKNNLTNFKWDCLTKVTDGCFQYASGFLASLMIAKQSKIGCIYTECLNTNFTRGHLMCVTNLDRYLDVYGHPLYDQSRKASKCPKPYTLRSTNYTNLCRCNNTEGCVIKPAELSPKCTKRGPVGKATLPPTKHVPKIPPAAPAPTEYKPKPMAFHEEKSPDSNYGKNKKGKDTSKTKKKISGLGGGGDTSGVKSFEDGDKFAFLFMMISFIFIY